MPATSDLSTLDRNAYRHTMKDGLTDVLFGAWLIAYGQLLGTGVSVLCLLAVLFLVPGLRRLQRRLTHPRIGFVEPRSPRSVHLFRGIVFYSLLVIAVFVLIFFLTGQEGTQDLYRWIPAVAGVICAGGLHYAAARSGLVRFYCYTAASIITGIAVSLANLPGRLDGIRLYLEAMGLLAAVVGATIFLAFLRRNPIQAEEEPNA